MKEYTPFLPAIITSLSGLVGVIVGFGLAFLENLTRERRIRNRIDSELMRGLLQEISTNHNKCNGISAYNTVSGYLETQCWDRIRYSDTLYSRITSKNDDIYQQSLVTYMWIGNINLAIGRYLIAIDSDTRMVTTTSGAIITLTLNNLKDEVTRFLPTLSSAETNLRQFLIKERYFKA